MNFQRVIKFLADPWLVFGSIGFGIALLAATLMLLTWTRSPQAPDVGSTALITVIAVPTDTEVLPTSIPPTEEPPPATDFPNPPGGDIAIDAYVQVTGTGGGGLRLREGPGLDRTVRILGAEEEIFLVIDGPQQADSYTWWNLEGPFDETRHGWAVSNFLRVVQNP
jgi:hypothetical protein